MQTSSSKNVKVISRRQKRDGQFGKCNKPLARLTCKASARDGDLALQDQAHAILYLASVEAVAVQGIALPVNGDQIALSSGHIIPRDGT